MSMKPQPIPEIPAETIRVVRAAFPKGHLYIHLRDTLGSAMSSADRDADANVTYWTRDVNARACTESQKIADNQWSQNGFQGKPV